jgi:Tfp pilus assembly protein PilN
MSAQRKIKNEGINLLPKKGFYTTLAGRVLTWILSTFRGIVIFTEVIVMLAFLSRFWLDAKNSDLSDEIDQKQAVIISTLDFEKEYKITQKKLTILKDVLTGEIHASNILKNITESVPNGISLTSLNFGSSLLTISGNSTSEIEIQQLIVNLKSHSNFKKISIANISLDPIKANLINFQLRVDIGEGGKDKT